jgi:hypothetical protein
MSAQNPSQKTAASPSCLLDLPTLDLAQADLRCRQTGEPTSDEQKEAWDGLFRTCDSWLEGWVKRYRLHREEAQECLQEARLKIVQNLAAFETDGTLPGHLTPNRTGRLRALLFGELGHQHLQFNGLKTRMLRITGLRVGRQGRLALLTMLPHGPNRESPWLSHRSRLAFLCPADV